MGMAHRAPMDTYRRKFFILSHAVLRLRERLGPKHPDYSRNEADLGNLLDATVAEQMERDGEVERLMDGEDPAWLVRMFDRFPGCWALVKVNHVSHPVWRKSVITVLTDSMVVANRTRPGRWTWGDEADARAAVEVRKKCDKKMVVKLPLPEVLLKPAVKPTSVPAAVTPAPAPAPQPALAEVPSTAQPMRLVCWSHAMGGKMMEVLAKDQAASHVDALMDLGVDPTTIHVFKLEEVKLRVRVQLEE